ncbi:MAG: hypothetical protein MJZ81_09435 [Bacteroidales bacterium]|nr:hypothetical protein [Bacteroidales bacterium]MCQ2299274.1 hypothetical protein [Bacteroidales bacterium]MCQ2300330.1 hypothetical protein [Bacteroidales bacterium]
MIKDIKKYYFFTLLASLTLPRLSNIQASLILPSTIAMFDSERHLSSFHSVLKIQDVAWVRKSLQAVFSLTLRNVTMHRISFSDTAASRQSKRACSALDFCSVAPSFKEETC